MFGMIINNISFVLIWVFLVKTAGNIGGWTTADIFGLQGMVAITYGSVLSVGAGLREMPRQISAGVFDQFLLSPKNLLTRIATSSFSASAVGDVVFGLTCLIIYLVIISAGPSQIFLLLALIPCSILLFIGVIIAIQSISFYFSDPESLVRGVFELFLSPSLFHGGAFQGNLRFVFTFLVPALAVGTLPVEAVSHLSYAKAGLVALLSILWFLFSLWLFKRAVRNYESANFMTFGG